MGDIKYNNSDLGIKYTNLNRPQITTGFQFSSAPYKLDSDGNLLEYPEPLINATDINWGGVNIGADNVYNTDELLSIISSKWVNDFGEAGALGISIMLQAIRALQAEVVKLRNSIVDGIYSYTGKQTKMSYTVDQLTTDIGDSKEPLWAVDETTLSEIISIDLSVANQFEHDNSIIVNTENNTLTFTKNSTWKDKLNLLSNITDPKIYVYLESTGLDITFHLIEHNDPTDKKDIKIKDLFNSNENNLYNILFILATSVKKSEDSNEYIGSNFVWIQVGHYIYDAIQQGYYEEYYEQDDNNPNVQIKNARINSKSLVTFGDKRYIIDSIDFNNLTLSKFNIYSKYQNFSNEVESINPNENDRYKVAHITIRSIETYDDLVEIQDQLPENELIYVEKGNTLYIKNGYKIKKLGIGGEEKPGPQTIDTMTNKELLTALKQMGIVYEHYSENADSHDYDLQLAALDSVTFINQATGKKFDISVDAYGKLKSIEQSEDSLAKQINNMIGEGGANYPIQSEKYIGPNDSGVGFDIRGFNAHINYNLEKLAGNEQLVGTTYESEVAKDFKLNSDRIRIASIYAPLTTDQVYGCSHGFLEIENSGDKDFYLDGCSIFYTNQTDTYELPLSGKVPAGGTYLIRCKQFADPKFSSNVYINVDTYDIEWWITKTIIENGQEKQVKELLDTSLDTTKIISYALVHLDETLTTLTPNTKLFLTVADGVSEIKDNTGWANLKASVGSNIKDTAVNKIVYSYDPHLVDAITLNKDNPSNWAINNFKTIKNNSIYKNTFELDPAKQAYNGFNMYESSRVRWNKPGTDSQTLELSKEYIEFYHTTEKKAVKDYTPKASFEHKNVCTDKTQLDMEKPNMPTVSFGIDIFKTRCFNWISCGLYDEYVFIKQDNGTWKNFASYTTIESLTKMPTEKGGYPRRYEYTNKDIADGYTSLDINNSTYARFTFNLPANGTQITSHKCIIDIRDSSTDLDAPKVYTYIVGRADKNGNPDFEHCSKELTFTIYPKSYIPRIYQITDQQGFHWIEYQAWGAAAKKVLEKINNDQQNENIIPIIINTGDAVQAGCRINEWLDYYIGGECLFDHLEQMEVVGNNDLCMTDFTKLGTGDDEGKSNSFFYSLFYCYQMDPQIPTLIRGLDDNYENYNGLHYNNIRYIPSLYYFEYNNGDNKIRFVNVNSEITYVNARDWFRLDIPGTNKQYIINPYNGYCFSETSGYTTHEYVIDNATHTLKTGDTTVACHEMPFTVVTHANMLKTSQNSYRSQSGKSLVGSHLNQLLSTEIGKGTYWFSRLLEYKGVKLCIGGHKHTYCYTYPLREYYLYDCTYYTAEEVSTANAAHAGDESWLELTTSDAKTYKTSYDDGPMKMYKTLKNDSIEWVCINSNNQRINTSKFPITNRTQASIQNLLDNIANASNYFIPVTIANSNDNSNFVTYFMCQATGYKLKSNKELPTPIQAFTQVLPLTSPSDKGDTPNANQQYPMFGIISFDFENSEVSVKNVRVAEIYLRGAGSKGEAAYDPYKSSLNFTQQKFSKNPMKLQYLVDINYYNSQCWNNDDNTYGDHYNKLDSYNKDNPSDVTNSEKLNNGKINFNNYGVWTEEEMNISNPLSI